MPYKTKEEKAAYDRRRRQEKRDLLSAYEVERGKQRRSDPVYAAEQLERKRAWREKNRERHRATSRAYDSKQRAENLQRRISKNLRHRLRKAVLGLTTGVSAVRDLGMSISEFRGYLADRFQPGMTWANYGDWHIDHIRPLKAFDLTQEDQVRAACHYSNMQPLWADENQRKWCKLDHHLASRRFLGLAS